jgi:hypothetical protein
MFFIGAKMTYRNHNIFNVPKELMIPNLIAICIILGIVYFIISTLLVRSAQAIFGGIIGLLLAPLVRIGEIPALILLLVGGYSYTRYVDNYNASIIDEDAKIMASLLEGIPLGILVGQIVFEF